ncbi:hypothetical protein GCM10023205_03750 [Yinghuangia aomiensis]|uniref:Histidine kinase/HSP90-like ATPase domain-containing protein n=1 Tax=Yinghuangia aomiensis TaxID=676205 RepID=A0ABP9GL97_9ACTN
MHRQTDLEQRPLDAVGHSHAEHNDIGRDSNRVDDEHRHHVQREDTAGRHQRIRHEVTARKLADWGAEGLAITAELIVSELVTNSVRYAPGAVELRLILRENTLACEVTDTNSAAPRLRRAHDDDEGGRGLFLVAQLAQDWGARWNPHGKTIWAELPLMADESDTARALPGAPRTH